MCQTLKQELVKAVNLCDGVFIEQYPSRLARLLSQKHRPIPLMTANQQPTNNLIPQEQAAPNPAPQMQSYENGKVKRQSNDTVELEKRQLFVAGLVCGSFVSNVWNTVVDRY